MLVLLFVCWVRFRQELYFRKGLDIWSLFHFDLLTDRQKKTTSSWFRLAGPHYIPLKNIWEESERPWALHVAVRHFTLFHQDLCWLSCLALSNFRHAFVRLTLWLGSACFTRRFWPPSCPQVVLYLWCCNVYSEWCSYPAFLMHLTPSQVYTQWRCSVSSLLVLCTVNDWTPNGLLVFWLFRPRKMLTWFGF